MRWRRFLRRGRWDEERARELASYLEIEIDEQIARGRTPAEARAAAYRKLGNPTRIREEIFEMNTIGLVDAFVRDLRYGLRLMRRTPAFTVVALLSLALGIGANTALFQLIDAVRLRTLPVSDPGSLVEVRVDAGDSGRTGRFLGRRPMVSTPVFEALETRQQVLDDLAAWATVQFDLAEGGESRPAEGLWVTGRFFRLLDVRPEAGRLIAEADDVRGCADPPVVVSDRFARREFGLPGDAVGRTIRLDGRPLTVVGVTEASFFGVEVGRSFDVALPACAQPWLKPSHAVMDSRLTWWLSVLGRLRPGVTIERATAELDARAAGIFADTVSPDYTPEDARAYLEFGLAAYPAGLGFSGLRTEYATPLTLLLGIAGLVLLVACANLANLMLARASAREREVAVRLAIGASRGRVLRQMLAESLLLAVIGATAGVWLADSLSRALIALLASDGTPLVLDVPTDWRMLGFAGGLALLTTLVFGLAPALRATRTTPQAVMRTGGRGLTASRERFSLRRALVAGQMAISLVLLVGALLFVGSLSRLGTVDPGFTPDPVLRADIDFRPARVPPGQVVAWQHDTLERLRALPGVVSAATADIVPFGGSNWNQIVVLDGVRQEGRVNLNRVSPRYFDTLQTPFVAGRDFNDRDTATSPPVAIVNVLFTERYLGVGPGTSPQSAVGRRFRLAVGPSQPDPEYTVVGVVADSHYGDLRETLPVLAYFAAAQDAGPLPFSQVLLRASGDPDALRPAVTQALADIDRSVLVTFQSLSAQVRNTLLRERLMATLSGGFAVLAVLLAAVGLYGLLAYTVTRRRNEIGIRVALGATRGRIVRMIVGETAALVATGFVVGLALAVVAARAASTLLFGLAPWDPVTLAAAVVLLGGAALLAVAAPARRAATLEPVRALRED